MEIVKEIIKQYKNLIVIGYHDLNDKQHALFFKHIHTKISTRYVISFIEEEDLYDVWFDCNRGVANSFGIIEDTYLVKDKQRIEKDFNKLFKMIGDDEPNEHNMLRVGLDTLLFKEYSELIGNPDIYTVFLI